MEIKLVQTNSIDLKYAADALVQPDTREAAALPNLLLEASGRWYGVLLRSVYSFSWPQIHQSQSQAQSWSDAYVK